MLPPAGASQLSSLGRQGVGVEYPRGYSKSHRERFGFTNLEQQGNRLGSLQPDGDGEIGIRGQPALMGTGCQRE